MVNSYRGPAATLRAHAILHAEVVGLLIGGCLLIGIGIGLWTGDAGPGAMIGLGVGLVIQYVFGEDGLYKKWRRNANADDKGDSDKKDE